MTLNGPRRTDLCGVRVGRLTVLEFAGVNKYRNAYWRCVCDCGEENVVLHSSLSRGRTKSCGCLLGKHIKTHGMSGLPEYRLWKNMIARCRYVDIKRYSSYAGRGIRVADEWNDFEKFYADMGPRPSPAYSLERLNNDGNYEPGNVVWATRKEQVNNTTRSRRIEVLGETMTVAQASEKYCVPSHRILSRLNRGWDPDKAVFVPPDPSRKFKGAKNVP